MRSPGGRSPVSSSLGEPRKPRRVVSVLAASGLSCGRGGQPIFTDIGFTVRSGERRVARPAWARRRCCRCSAGSPNATPANHSPRPTGAGSRSCCQGFGVGVAALTAAENVEATLRAADRRRRRGCRSPRPGPASRPGRDVCQGAVRRTAAARRGRAGAGDATGRAAGRRTDCRARPVLPCTCPDSAARHGRPRWHLRTRDPRRRGRRTLHGQQCTSAPNPDSLRNKTEPFNGPLGATAGDVAR